VPGGGEPAEGRTEGFRPVVAVAADQPEATAIVDDDDQAMTVMFDLVQPALAIEGCGLGVTIGRRTEAGWRAGNAPSGRTGVGIS
jgi:hypothetical protein